MILTTNRRLVEPDITVLALSGRLSLGNTLMFLENEIRKMIEQQTRRLVLDLSDLQSIDSAGIGMLVACNGMIEQAGGRLCLAGANGVVAESFHTIHINRIISDYADVDAACESFQQA
jgi:anti-sigma B factor antagonist